MEKGIANGLVLFAHLLASMDIAATTLPLFGTIATITKEAITGQKVIDATGHVVAPGFHPRDRSRSARS
jgi:dihydroorotase-like cyclic amidohydrolase